MNKPRVLFSGIGSGTGKTSAVCAVLSLLKRRGVSVKACKCGPDYIDPMFHRAVQNTPCANLDPFFCDKNLLRYILSENSGEDITVIEGAMGYYDGTGEDGTDNSAYSVARMTKTPVILIIDAKGSSASTAALIEGFLNYAPDSRIRGVLFNRSSPRLYQNAAKLIMKRFGGRIVPVGYIPELPEECRIPSRYLGLVTADEIDDLAQRLEKAADLCEGAIDIDAIMTLAESAEEPDFKAPDIPTHEPIQLAVAYDRAFCFYYSETLALFEKTGAKIIYFSPLKDEPLPARADGLLLGGGYPELYARTLEANRRAKESIASAIKNGLPTIAECGGFHYLGAELDGRKMCGVLPHKSYKTDRLVRFGYIAVTSKQGGLLGGEGTVLKAHEFHYWDSTENGGAFRAVKPDGRAWECGVMTDTLYAGYPHLYLYSNLSAAESFYRKCLDYKRRKGNE